MFAKIILHEKNSKLKYPTIKGIAMGWKTTFIKMMLIKKNLMTQENYNKAF